MREQVEGKEGAQDGTFLIYIHTCLFTMRDVSSCADSVHCCRLSSYSQSYYIMHLSERHSPNVACARLYVSFLAAVTQTQQT